MPLKVEDLALLSEEVKGRVKGQRGLGRGTLHVACTPSLSHGSPLWVYSI